MLMLLLQQGSCTHVFIYLIDVSFGGCLLACGSCTSFCCKLGFASRDPDGDGAGA
jgi:hypothetical protein